MASVGVWMGAEVGGEEEVSRGETPAPLAPLILRGYTEGHCYNTAPDLRIPPLAHPSHQPEADYGMWLRWPLPHPPSFPPPPIPTDNPCIISPA